MVLFVLCTEMSSSNSPLQGNKGFIIIDVHECEKSVTRESSVVLEAVVSNNRGAIMVY